MGKKLDELRKSIYEPDHEIGGLCWCGPTFFKREGNYMEIVHNTERDRITRFVQENFDERE